MMRRLAFLLTVLLLLTGALLARADLAIEGLGDDDLALLAASGMDADTLFFDLLLDASLEGDPTLAMGFSLAGAGALGVDDAGLPLMTVELAGTSSDPVIGEAPAQVSLRLVDNVLYLRMSENEAWQSMPLDESLTAAGLPADTSEMAGAQAVDFLGWLEFLGLAAFSSGARSDADGAATIRIDVNLDGWLLSPDFAELMALAGDASGDESLATMGPMLGMLLEDVLLTIVADVALDSGLMQRLSLDLGLGVNSAMLGGSGSAPATSVSLILALQNMRHGGALEVSAPEGAVPADV